jgi:ribosomal-protein-alanine N-acetyltransferase
MSFGIRSATLNDVPAIRALEQRAPSASHWTAGQYNNLIRSGIVLIAGQAEGLYGFISAQAVAAEWEIENVVVALEFLRRGIATELMREVIKRARLENASTIRLEVRESNQAARALYEKLNFRQEGRRPAYYRDPAEAAVVYALQL